MKRSQNKQISPFLFLLLIGGFGWLAMNYIGENDSNVKTADNASVLGEQTTISPSQALQPVYVDEDYEPIIIDVPSSLTTDITGEVLAVTGSSSVGDCNAYSDVLDYQPICVQGTTSVNFNDSIKTSNGSVDSTTVNVSKDSIIEIAEITEPILQEGSPFFEKANRAISNEFPSNSATGAAVSYEYMRARCLPGADCERVTREYQAADRNPSFGVRVNAAFDPNDDITSTVVINQDRYCNMPNPKIDCIENPNIANINAANVENTFKLPTGPQDDEGPQILGSCKTFAGSNTLDYRGISTVACNAEINFVKDFLTAVFSIGKQEECALGDDNCTKGFPIVIRVGSLHGSADSTTGYTKGESANSYLSLRRRNMRAPGDTSIDREGAEVDSDINTAYTQPIYARTKCKVKVDGITHPVDCIWDVSYIAEWYERQRVTTVTSPEQSKERDAIPYDLETYIELVNDEMAKSF